ncbi:MAG: nuclear transport factor 2 family protein [Melioribacteraceae bacterium]|nr:nuclear transport factor 2 family protein [Melioribacteraceae bacterium]
MKRLIQAIIVITILISGMSNIFANEQDVKSTVNQYLNAVNDKEATLVDNLSNDETTFTMINSIIGKKEILSESDYLQFVEDGKAGAWVTNSEIKFVDLQDNLAVALVEFEGKSLLRKEYLTLAMTDGKWEIINSVSSLSKK